MANGFEAIQRRRARIAGVLRGNAREFAVAMDHLQRALRIDPHHKLALENLEQINRDPKNLQQ